MSEIDELLARVEELERVVELGRGRTRFALELLGIAGRSTLSPKARSAIVTLLQDVDTTDMSERASLAFHASVDQFSVQEGLSDTLSGLRFPD